MDATLTPEIVDDATKTQNAMVESARKLAANITDEHSYVRAGDTLIEIKNWRTWWDKLTKPTRDAAKLALDNARAMFKKLDDPLELCETELKRGRGAYRAKVDEENRVKQAKIQEQLKKQAEDTKINTAVALEEAGQAGLAEQVLDAPTFVPPVVLPGAPKTAGTAYRTLWKFEIEDEAKIPREFMTPNLKMIGETVRSHKEKCSIPGVRVYTEQTEAVGGIR